MGKWLSVFLLMWLGGTAWAWTMAENMDDFFAREIPEYVAEKNWRLPEDRDQRIRSHWSGLLNNFYFTVARSGNPSDTPTTVDGIKNSPYLLYIPDDRFQQTPLVGLPWKDYTPTDLRRRASLQDEAPEGSVVIRKIREAEGRPMIYRVAVVWYDLREAQKAATSFNISVNPRRNEVFLARGYFHQTATVLGAYIAFFGRAPEKIEDLDGTFVTLNKKALEDPLVRRIVDATLAEVKKRNFSFPPFGELEPLPVKPTAAPPPK